MATIFTLTSMLLLVVVPVSAQVWSMETARSEAMGSASIANREDFIALANPASLTEVKAISAGSGYRRSYSLTSLDRIYAGFTYPAKIVTTLLSLSRTGDELYSEQVVETGIAHRINRVALGVKLGLIQYSIRESQPRRSLVLSLGGIVKVTDHIDFGTFIWNLNQAKKQYTKEYLPTLIRSGFSYHPTDKVTLNMEVYKDIRYASSFRCGLEYLPIKWFAVRTGLSTAPVYLTAGAGVRKKTFGLDYSFHHHSFLGAMHHFTLLVTWRKQNIIF